MQADDYLVSPEIVLSAGQKVTLSWWFRVNKEYPEDNYAVMLWGNNTGRTTLVDITPTAEQGDWTQQTLDISSYAGQSVWLAFYHHGYDNNYIALDDILITVDDITGIYQVESGKLKVESSEIYDLQGRRVTGKPTRRGLYIKNGQKIMIR